MGLAELASSVGVLTTYLGADGRPVEVTDDALAAVLEQLGVDTTIAPERAAAAWRDARASGPHVDVVWDEPPYGYEPLASGGLRIRAPRRAAAVDRRRLGLFAPAYAARHHRRRDVGDLSGLRLLFDWGNRHGADTLLTLPLLAVFPEQASPYSPISRLHWNELYVSRPDPHTTELIDYPASYGRAHAWLDGIDPDGSRPQLGRPDIDDFARFRAASDVFGRNFRTWPDDWSERVPAPLVARYRTGQILLRGELRRLRQHIEAADGLLGLDLPLGTNPDGFDAWRFAELFATGLRAGAPPDVFFPGGQNWGFAPPLPHRAIESGYAYFRAALRNHLEFASLLRIDHVMQFWRLFCIPDGGGPGDGTYVRQPAEHYLAILCLESWLANVPIIGENLGLVPPEVDTALQTHGILGTWVAQAAVSGARNTTTLTPPPPSMLASLGTHDMPTWAGFVAGDDIGEQEALGVFRADEAAWRRQARADDLAATAAALGCELEPAALRIAWCTVLSQSAAELVVLNPEDLWLEPRPQNIPGTSTERPNWRRPFAVSVDDLDETATSREIDDLRAYRDSDSRTHEV